MPTLTSKGETMLVNRIWSKGIQLKRFSEFIIPFYGLKDGNHQFELEVNDSFFEEKDYSEVKKGQVKVILQMVKSSTMLILDFNIKGKIGVLCDRCSDEFFQPIESENKLIIRLGGEANEEEEADSLVLASGETEIDVTQYVYEFIILALPLKRVHPDNEKGESTCDPEVIKLLKKIEKHTENQENTDPRWQALKNIKLN